MQWFNELTVSNRIFLALNVLGAMVGIGLLIVAGPSLPLVLLVVGAIGLALKKLPPSVLGDNDPPPDPS
jgi:hypothetical protein